MLYFPLKAPVHPRRIILARAIEAGCGLAYYRDMDKPKPPANTGAESTGSLGRGIAAYQSTLKKKTASGEEGPALPPGRPPLIPGNGFVKTREKQPIPPGKPSSAGTPNLFAQLPKILPRPDKDTGEEDSKYRRVAKFLILIGGDEAAGILSQLDAKQVEAISREIASIRGITQDEGAEILAEFRSLLSSSYVYGGADSGGVEAARRLLYATFGPEKGEEFLNRTLPETKKNPFSFLENFSGEQIALLLKEESPATAALILSRLSAPLSASALVNTGNGRETEIVRRIAHQGQTAPEVLEQVAAALRERVRHIGAFGAGEAVDINGKDALAAILKQSDISFGDRILHSLEEDDPDLGQDLKERIHTLEDMIKAEDRPIQVKLRSLSDRDIALLLKGKTDGFVEKILSNVSAQRRIDIREEIRILGPVPRKDVEAVSQEFLNWFRLNREEGRILLIDDKDVIV
jgi:flagellar motor switch protein FliG